MFRIVSFTLLIRYIVIASTGVSVGVYVLLRSIWASDLPITRIFDIVPWVTLVIIFAVTNGSISRVIWSILRRFDSSLYPDLNGVWEGEITPVGSKKLSARAVIRQTLMQAQIDLHTETAKSLTLETTPAVESGQFKLYYTYLSKPKNPDWRPYTGCTIFDVRAEVKEPPRPLEISGYYFTDRKTNGRIKLRQVSKRTDTDVSYY